MRLLVIGNNTDKLCEGIKAEFGKENISIEIDQCNSKLGAKEQVGKADYDAIIVPELMASGPYTSQELIYLADNMSANCKLIPLLQKEHKGSPYLQDLYNNMVLDALLIDKDTRIIPEIHQIVTRTRSHVGARVYYGLS